MAKQGSTRPTPSKKERSKYFVEGHGCVWQFASDKGRMLVRSRNGRVDGPPVLAAAWRVFT